MIVTDRPALRLAHFVPLESVDLSKSTKKDLVINALFINNDACDINSIRNTIIEQLGCDIDRGHLKEILGELTKSEDIDKSQDKYVLNYSLYSKIETQRNTIVKFESTVIDYWIENTIKPKYSGLNSEELSELKNQLLQYLSTLFLSHGAESKSLIEGSRGDAQNTTTRLMLEKIKMSNDNLQGIAENEFVLFIGSSDANVRRYLESLVEKAFRYLTTICDPSVFETIKKSIMGKLLYLDSSTVYRLVNLQGEYRYRVTLDVINLCKEFGLQLKVTAMTMKELHRRIFFDSKVLKNYPAPTNLSAIGYKFYTEDNFVSSFWKQSKETGISVNDFITKYKNIDVLLENEGVEIEAEIPQHTDSFKKLWTELLSKINGREDHEKSHLAAEHDAYLIALLDQLRKEKTVNRFLDSPAWLLTTDQFLIRFQRTEYSYKDKVPFALIPTQLIEILRFIKPNEDKFNEMYLGFFSKTFIPVSKKLSNENIQMILARIGQYKGYTPLLAEKVLSDQYFTNSYSQTQFDGEREELIHEAIIEKAEELELLVNEKDSKLNELKINYDKLKEEKKKSEQVINEKEQELTNASQSLIDANVEMASTKEAITMLNEKIDGLEKNQNKYVAKGIKRKRRNIFLVKICITIFYMIGVTFFLFYLNDFPFINDIFNSIIMSLFTLGVIPLVYYLFNQKNLVVVIATGIGLVFTISAWYYAIL